MADIGGAYVKTRHSPGTNMRPRISWSLPSVLSVSSVAN